MQGEAEGLGAALEISDYPAAVALLILCGTGIMIGHALPQTVVEEHGDLACGGRDRFCLSRSGRQPAVEHPQGGVTSANGGCGETQECSGAA